MRFVATSCGPARDANVGPQPGVAPLRIINDGTVIGSVDLGPAGGDGVQDNHLENCGPFHPGSAVHGVRGSESRGWQGPFRAPVRDAAGQGRLGFFLNASILDVAGACIVGTTSMAAGNFQQARAARSRST